MPDAQVVPTDEAPPRFVDWDFAKATGRRLVGAGPEVSAAEAGDIVAKIRAAAAAAQEPVAETSRMHAPGIAPPAQVIDRPTWIDLNLDSMAALMTPVFVKVARDRTVSANAPGMGVGAKITGAESGALMAFMASKVLGQYDLAPQGTPRLLLVAPNLVAVQRELDVDPDDFRAWVCMHEETHRIQFTAVPWLREHMIERATTLAGELTPTPQELGQRMQEMVKRLPEALGSGGGGLADLFATPEQRAKIAEVTAIMSLLEGHADVVMDDVGPKVIPTVADIRAKFTERRKGAGAADRMLRRLLGLEAKMAQYKDGAGFVRGVMDKVGVDGFNAVWTSPETLPLPAEIHDPQAWVRRVHG
ncbi:MAG: zinc-dependent metalloprotease [Tetrasphaera sp.]|nr:zinc-dependent metalloprotease [Actinomycetota bacterium]MCB1302076.1 zinc-dependent metalloprotease [Tetrasphaera sp.]HPF82534.1 zinc-dependent metalloprotease [Tetrasphaera australiensis]HRW02878.1 zinc-dependent metalloprotease [Tetrasphaera sp.]